MRFFAYAGAKAAGQDDYFHWKPSENMDWEQVSRSQNYILDSLGCAGKPVVDRTVSKPLPKTGEISVRPAGSGADPANTHGSSKAVRPGSVAVRRRTGTRISRAQRGPHFNLD